MGLAIKAAVELLAPVASHQPIFLRVYFLLDFELTLQAVSQIQRYLELKFILFLGLAIKYAVELLVPVISHQPIFIHVYFLLDFELTLQQNQ